MRRAGICLLLIGLAYPGFAQPAPEFPVKRWFVADELNGADVRDKALTFFADIVTPDDTVRSGVGGFAGCNTWRALPEIGAPDRVRLSAIRKTRRQCAEGGVMLLEAGYLAAMAKVTNWRMDGVTLVLTGDRTIMRLSPRPLP